MGKVDHGALLCAGVVVAVTALALVGVLYRQAIREIERAIEFDLNHHERIGADHGG